MNILTAGEHTHMQQVNILTVSTASSRTYSLCRRPAGENTHYVCYQQVNILTAGEHTHCVDGEQVNILSAGEYTHCGDGQQVNILTVLAVSR